MPKINSDIWKYFDKTETKKVACKKCGKQLTICGNTTNFWNHLLIHNIKRPKINEIGNSSTSKETLEETEDSSTEGLTTSSQARIKRKRPLDHLKQSTLESSYERVKSYGDGGVRNETLNEALLFMICKDHMPLKTPERKGFRYFSKVAVPLWTPPSRATVTRLAEAKYVAMKDVMNRTILKLPSLSLTFDVWTETHTTTSYLGGTLHFLNEFEMETCILSVTVLEKSHTADYLKEVFKNICDTWGIDIAKVVLAVTDNAANIEKAARETFSTTITCFDHTLNLIPQYAIGCDSNKKPYVPGVPDLIAKIKKIVTFVNHSVSASDDLKQAQLKNGKTEGTVLHMIQEVSTRWSSAYFMIVRFLELSDVLGTVLLKYPKVTMLTGAEIVSIRSIAKLLHPLQLATAEMSADKTTTLSKVIPLVYLLKQRINNCDPGDDQLVIATQKFVLAELDRRFKKAEFVRPLAVATILDPRFKKVYFQSALAASEAINFITSKIKNDLEQAATVNPPKIQTQPAEISENSLWAVHDEYVKSQQQYHTEDFAGIPVELRQYLNRPILPLETNPFKAWDSMKIEYPNVYKQAIKYLPVTATSVPSERLFSTAGLILSDLRSRLTPKHFSQLLFLSSVSEKMWMTK